MKEMQPMYVATFSEKPAVLEGHPFVVEAGVSLGGAEASAFFWSVFLNIVFVPPQCL